MIFYVHIGKTGGTAIKRAIRAHYDVEKSKEPQVINDRIVLLNHASLAEAVKKFGDPSAIAFAFRDPAARFVSGFYCRQRMGYPDHNARWDAREAAAFAHFDTANGLAEALEGEDLAKRAAAHFAMDAIRHLRRGYQYHFGGIVDFALDYAPRVLACIETEHISDKGAAFLGKLGVNALPQPSEPNSKTIYPRGLSELAMRNLRLHWAAEFEYYEAFQLLERETLGAQLI